VLSSKEASTPTVKREVLEMLHVKVFIFKEEKKLKIEGWYGPPIEGGSYRTSTYCERKATAFVINVSLPR
jgi:hypothetical protein